MYIVPVVQVYVAGILKVFFSVGLCWGGVVLVWVHWAFLHWLIVSVLCMKFFRLYEVKDERHAEAFWNSKSLAKEDALPLGERVKALQNDRQVSGLPNDVKLGPGGSREISFITRSSAKYKEDEEDKQRHEKRRGVQALGLKSDRSGSQGRGGRGRGGYRGRARRGGRR